MMKNDIALMAVGSMVKTADEVRQNLKRKGFDCTLINARFVKPHRRGAVWLQLAKEHKLSVTLEENVKKRWIRRTCARNI